MGSSVSNRVLGYGLWSIWIANRVQRGYQLALEQGLNPPEEMGEWPATMALAMNKFTNYEFRGTNLSMNLHILREPAAKCRHRDRHGAEISCETNRYYHNREGYGLVGHWENDSGNTIVHTEWTGNWRAPFVTVIHSTDQKLDGSAREYETEEAATVGHAEACRYIQHNER